MDLGLTGKVALVAGASRGIGRAIAFSLAGEGAKVFLVARGSEDLARTEAELKAQGAQVASLSADLSTEAGAQRAVAAALEAFGSLEVLVNNAGGSRGA